VLDPPTACDCCGGSRLRKLGEDVTRTRAGAGQDRHGLALDLPARRPAVRRRGAAGGDLPLLARCRGEHPQAHLAGYAGILQADAYDGYSRLYLSDRKPGPIREAACWVHARRPFFAMADIEENARRKATGKKEIPLSPIAIEVVRRIDALFAIERAINGKSAEERLTVRQAESRPLVEALHAYLSAEVVKLARGHDLAKAIQCMLKRWPAFTLFLDDGRICMSNNAAERSLRGVALGRKSWLFCGSDRGGQRAAAMYSLIVTAKMNGVDPQAWLADVLDRIAAHPAHRLDELLPWSWKAQAQVMSAKAA
jgi:transposase